MEICFVLEPRMEEKHTILLDELEEVNEILFIGTGSVIVGYEINKMKKYCIRYDNYCIIGSYELAHNMRSDFVYTSLT